MECSKGIKNKFAITVIFYSFNTISDTYYILSFMLLYRDSQESSNGQQRTNKYASDLHYLLPHYRHRCPLGGMLPVKFHQWVQE